MTTASGPAPASTSGAHFVAERLLVCVREEISRADTKASALLTGATAVLVLLFGRGGQQLAPPTADAALFLTGALLWTAGIAMFVTAVLPRTRTRADGDLTFFPRLSRGAPAAAVLPRVDLAGLDTTRWAVEQACALGLILAAKYRWLRCGVGCVSIGGLFAVAGELC